MARDCRDVRCLSRTRESRLIIAFHIKLRDEAVISTREFPSTVPQHEIVDLIYLTRKINVNYCWIRERLGFN